MQLQEKKRPASLEQGERRLNYKSWRILNLTSLRILLVINTAYV